MENTKAAWHRAYYHGNPDKLLRPWDYRRSLEKAFRRVVKRQADERSRFEKAARKVLTKRDPVQIKLARTLRRRFQKAFRYRTDLSAASQKLVGCPLPALRRHLESRWLPGMAWENYGFYGWHIDHIRPLAKFDLTDPTQVAEAFHFSNLQPLWAKDNLSKSDTIL